MKVGYIKVIVGVVVIGGAAGYMAYTLQSSWRYYLSVDEFQANQAVWAYPCRVGGVVEAGSVKIDLEGVRLEFVLVGQRAALPVVYPGSVPDNFQENREVLVEGRLDGGGIFQADRLITQCESKYQSKLNEEIK